MSSSDETNLTIEDLKEKNNKKSLRKQKRAHHRLLRDMNIKCSCQPTQVNINNQSVLFQWKVLFSRPLSLIFYFTALDDM